MLVLKLTILILFVENSMQAGFDFSSLVSAGNYMTSLAKCALFGQQNTVHYFIDDDVYETKLAEFGDQLVVIMFAENWGQRAEPLYKNFERSAFVFPSAAFFVVDPSKCPRLKEAYSVERVPTVAMRKKKRDVVRYEGDAVHMMESLVEEWLRSSPVIVPADDADFAAVMRAAYGKVIVVQFVRKSCERCHLFLPIYEDLATEFPDVTFLRVDVDRCPGAAAEYSAADSVPKTVFKVFAKEVAKPLLDFNAIKCRVIIKGAKDAWDRITDPSRILDSSKATTT